MGSPEQSAQHAGEASHEAAVPAAQQVNSDNQPLDSFWARIKRHKVVEWTLAYVAFGYALLHGVQMLRETFDWPFLVPRLTVFGLVLGAPIAVTLAWYHGHRARHRVSGQELSILIALLVVAGSVLWWVSRNTHERVARPAVADTTVSPAPSTASFNPPPHSIAVLPFVNLSGDKEQEYFSEGLTEELLNSLAQINDLQVAARTSSFSFKEHPDVVTVAHKLNVATVLEGSVRRSSQTVRVTAQLINAVTGFHLWSKTYDRDVGDVLKLQTEIATAVASALTVSLLGNEAARIELRGTRNTAAFDAYLRGSRAYNLSPDPANLQSAIAAYTEALGVDPNYALALAGRARARCDYASGSTTGTVIREDFDKAQADARQAIALAPELAEAHAALGRVSEVGTIDFTQAREEYERALALAPGDALVLRDAGHFAVLIGRFDVGVTAVHRAVALDPLNPQTRNMLGEALYFARRYGEAIATFGEALSLESDFKRAAGFRGLAYYGLGDFRNARSTCESKPDFWASKWCLAITYDKLGQHGDAEAMLKTLQATYGTSGAYQFATVYAQWGDTAKALEWLATSMRLRDPGLAYVKTDPLLDPLRKEPRFQAIERGLKFPERQD